MEGLGEWNIEDKISDVPVDDCREVGNHELGEAKVNNDLSENQLGNLQYKLSLRNEKFNRERSQRIIEQETQRMRKEIAKRENYIRYWWVVGGWRWGGKSKCDH